MDLDSPVASASPALAPKALPHTQDHAALALYALGMAEYADGEWAEAQQQFVQALAQVPPDMPALHIRCAIALAAALHAQGQSSQALVLCDQLVQRHGSDPQLAVRQQLVKAMYNQAQIFDALQQPEAELAVFAAMAQRYGQDPDPAVRECLAGALFNRCITLRQYATPAEAQRACTDFLEHFALDTTPAVRGLQAQVLLELGSLLAAQQRWEDELDAYDLLVRQFGNDPEPAQRQRVAQALLSASTTLGQARRTAEEMAVYDQLQQRFGLDPAPALRERVAQGLRQRATRLLQLGQTDAALAGFAHITHNYCLDPGAPARLTMAQALLGQGLCLNQQGQTAAEMAAYSTLAQRYRPDDAPALQECVCQAQLNLAALHVQQADTPAALATLDSVIGRFETQDAPPLREPVLRALLQRAQLLEPDQPALACSAYAAIDQRYGADPAPAVRLCVAQALLAQADGLCALGHSDAACALYQQAVQRYSDNADSHHATALREPVARARLALAGLHSQQPPQAALALYADVVQRYRSDTSPALRVMVARSLLMHGSTLLALQRHADAAADFREVQLRHAAEQHDSLTLREIVAQALLLEALAHPQAPAAALQPLERLVQHYSADSHPALRLLVAKALLHQGRLLESTDRFTEAQASYQQLVQHADCAAITQPSPALPLLVAQALHAQALGLALRKHTGQGLQACHALLQRFADDPAPELQTLVRKAQDLQQMQQALRAEQPLH